jgi:hypothetical protein
MKVKFLGHDPELGRKFLAENDGLILGTGQDTSDDEDDDEVDEQDLYDYLMDEGLPIDAQNLHDAERILRERRAKQRDGK